MIDDFEKELSDAIGQRNIAWHKERLGRFTSSRFGDLMATGAAATTARRKRLDNALKDKEISQDAYNAEMRDIEEIEYNARFGDGCKTYVYEKIAEILTQSVHMTGGSAATEWGNDNEANAAEYYEQKTGKKVKPAGFIKYGEFAGGSPDGEIVGENGIIEIKCPYNPANHIRLMVTNELPKSHFWQVHGNILATGAEYCDYISYDPRMIDEENKMIIVRVNRDSEVQKILIERINEVSYYMNKILNK